VKGLEIIGPFRGATGHDRHTREFTRHLVQRGVPVQLTQLHGWSPDLPDGARDEWFESLRREETDVALHFTMPTLCRPRPRKINVNYTMFEADRLPPQWAACAGMHERIIVPTRSSFDAWTASGIPAEKLRIAPFGVNGDYFGTPVPPLPIALPNGRPFASYAHRFLNIGDLRPRKNHLGLLRTWLRATNKGDDAALVMKLSGDSRSLQLFSADVMEMQQRLGRGMSDAAPVMVVAQILADGDLRALYHSATHYISMSCGEGWDFPMTESAAAGLHLIAPRHSAYCEYLGEEDASWIPAPRVPAVIEGRAGAEDRLWFDGTCWWRPDEDAAAEAIRGIIAGRPAAPSPRERLCRDYRWDIAAARLHEALIDL